MNGQFIYRAAELLIDQYGTNASTYTMMCVHRLLMAGDVDAVSVWKRIGRAIEELQATAPKTQH